MFAASPSPTIEAAASRPPPQRWARRLRLVGWFVQLGDIDGSWGSPFSSLWGHFEALGMTLDTQTGIHLV